MMHSSHKKLLFIANKIVLNKNFKQEELTPDPFDDDLNREESAVNRSFDTSFDPRCKTWCQMAFCQDKEVLR